MLLYGDRIFSLLIVFLLNEEFYVDEFAMNTNISPIIVRKVKSSTYFSDLIVPRRSTRVKLPIVCFQGTNPVRWTLDTRNRSRRKSSQRKRRRACHAREFCTEPGSLSCRATCLSETFKKVSTRSRGNVDSPAFVMTGQPCPDSPTSTTTVRSALTLGNGDTVSVHIITDN